MRFKKLIAGTALAALMIAGTSFAFAADDTQSAAQDQPGTEHAKKHEKHEGKHQLTQEQKDAIKAAGVDFKALKEQRKQIHDAFKDLKTNGNELRELVKNSGDKDLKKQVHDDLKALHEQMGRLKDLRKSGKELHREMRAAIEAKDSAKIKAAYDKISAHQAEELKLVQASQSAVKAELEKVRGAAKQ
jgi:hypothetical protein